MILLGTILVLTIIALATWRLAKKASRPPIRAANVSHIIWINGCLVMVMFILIGGLWYGIRVWQYGRCVDSASSRQSFRATTNGIYDTIDQATNTPFYTSELRATVVEIGPRKGEYVTLREALEINQPPKDRTECEHP